MKFILWLSTAKYVKVNIIFKSSNIVNLHCSVNVFRFALVKQYYEMIYFLDLERILFLHCRRKKACNFTSCELEQSVKRQIVNDFHWKR